MKILQVTNFFKPSWESGGVARSCYEISKHLSLNGNDVTVYTTDGFKTRLNVQKNIPVDVDGIRVYYFYNLFHKLVRKINLTSPYYLPFVLRKEIKNFDIIHIHEHRTPLAVFVHYYAKKYDIPYVLQSHGSVLKIMRMDKLKTLFDKIFGYAILRDASKLIAVSNFEVDQYKQMNVPEEKITVIPNGIDLDSFKNLPPKGTFREKFSISEKHIILFLGRINEIKGIDFLIRSYAKLNDEIEDTVLIIAGSDDGYKSRAESLITELNLENKVKFVGYISGVDNLAAYVDADVLVYPSIFEIFGLVPFEAIMCGTPVIVTEECGCGEIIKEINCGLVVKYGDIADLKEKIYFCIRNQNDLAKLIDKGRKYIYLNFDYNCITDKLTAVFAKPNKK